MGGKVIGEYKNSCEYVNCICSNGHNCNPQPRSVISGQGICKICAKNDHKTAKLNFNKEVEKLGGRVVGDYVRSNDPVECICSYGHKCKPSLAGLQRGRGICKTCNRKTERKVSEFLNEMYSVTSEFKDEWCRTTETNRKLSFDFLLNDYKLIIEIDGPQHFIDMKCWYSNREDVQKRDLYKMDKALENGYSILRIYQPDIYSESINWKQKIIDTVESLKQDATPKISFYANDTSIYNNHISHKKI